MYRRAISWLVITLLALSAACAPALQIEETPTPIAAPTESFIAPQFQAAKERLAMALGYPIEKLALVSFEQVDWRDSCLEALPDAEGCLDVLTPGYRAIFSSPQGEIEVRLDEQGVKVIPLLSMPGGIPTATQPGSALSGAQGQILVGPLCPGPVVEGQECSDQPYQGKFVILDASDAVAAQFETDSQGGFRVELPPGAYTLQPADMSGFMTPQLFKFEVQKDQFTQIEVSLDTGIR